jgi:hypothetical protein
MNKMMRKFCVSVLLFFIVVGSYAQLPKNGWSFAYPADNFTDNALLDLRYLNENIAGENGFIQLSADGNSFQTENGTPVRFWSINGGDGTKSMSDADLAKFARFLAKMGVNMIRYHGSINPTGANINEVDKTDVTAIWRMVAAMKKEGIYSTISPFWAHFGHMGEPKLSGWGIPGYTGSDDLWGVMFFSDTLKNAYKQWVKYLYTEKNSFTGIALKDDPAVGLIQVKNEDGLFWWTVSSMKEGFMYIVRQKYYQWAVAKYGSPAAVKTAWSNASESKDNWTSGELGLYNIWDATQPQTGGKAKRISDQIQFLTETQQNFYAEMHDYYRSLGCKQLINSNNWKTADATLLFDAERYTNTACEVIAVNRYYDPGHVGPNAGWRIDPGDYYVGKSVLFEPHKLPVNIKQVAGHPMLVTESAWNLPHKYQAEGPFLVSAFMSLTGVDSYYWFSPTSAAFDPNPYFTWANLPGGQHPMHRWTISTPGQLAMFPANALIFRKGLISEGSTVVHEERTLASIYERKMPLISEENSFDPNRDSYSNINPAKETAVSPLAHLAGKIEVVYDSVISGSVVSSEISDNIDYQTKIIKAVNDQIEWDYKNGVCVVNAPSAKGVCGFVKSKQSFNLNDVIIETTNDYLTVNIVAMDGKPVGESSKMLIQAGTVYQPTAWTETATAFEQNGKTVSGYKIENTGRMPWKCANTMATVKIKNKGLNLASLLDAAGYAKSMVNIVDEGEFVKIELPANAMYVMLEKSTGVGDNRQKEKGMKIFPNPSNGTFSVEISNFKYEEYTFELIGLQGNKISQINEIREPVFLVDTGKLSPGVFFAILKNKSGEIETEKIVIQNN